MTGPGGPAPYSPGARVHADTAARWGASPAVRISVFVAGLCVVFGAAFGIGRAVGPWDVDTAPAHETHQIEQTTEVHHDGH